MNMKIFIIVWLSIIASVVAVAGRGRPGGRGGARGGFRYPKGSVPFNLWPKSRPNY